MVKKDIQDTVQRQVTCYMNIPAKVSHEHFLDLQEAHARTMQNEDSIYITMRYQRSSASCIFFPDDFCLVHHSNLHTPEVITAGMFSESCHHSLNYMFAVPVLVR